MPDGTTNTATPPAASGGLTKEEVSKLIQDGVSKAVETLTKSVGDTLKPFIDRLGETEKNLKTVADTVASTKVIGEDQVKALVAGETQALATRAQQDAATKQAAEELAGKRKAFASEHLKNVPARYHELGDDESKWAEKATAIRSGFADEMKAAGVKVADVGGNAGGAAVEGKAATGGFLKMPAAAGAAAAS